MTERKTHRVWDGVLDGKYLCHVDGYSDDWYEGVLTIRDKDTDTILHAESVGIAYGARFGPDMDDVDEWTNLCINFIDKKEQNNG
jgi:hypothetical protein